MTTISDIVQINSGYTSYVDLYEDYYDFEKNHGRMERYKPITAHRKVFEKVANALNPLDRRFYFLSGSYGTGKSHLLLMMANYFANPSDLPEIQAFFKNYEEAQNSVLLRPGETLQERRAASLRDARTSGRYLVALCRFTLNLDFEGAVLRALEDALEKEGTDLLVDSHYREALRRIEDWASRQNDSRFYADLQSAVKSLLPDWTINDLIDGLNRYDEHALKAFRKCYKQVTDSDFAHNKDNLQDIISDFLANPGFKDKYKGIVFIYDEFGSAIDSGLVQYQTLLGFAQYCTSSALDRGGEVIFIGSGHKSFRIHGQLGDYNAETLEARVTEIGLETQGMEDIIAAIVHPKKDSDGWKNKVVPQTGKFTQLSAECNRLKMFNWLTAPRIRNNIIENIYPMHPMATFALLRLASEAGSDSRSVFKFFAPEFDTGEKGWENAEPFSYPWFADQNEILSGNKLSLYTADMLVDYFKDSLKATNSRLVQRVKNSVANYEETLRTLKTYLERQLEDQLFADADDLMYRILKMMLINEIASTQQVTILNNAQNIEFGLDYVSPEEKIQVEDRLTQLCNAGVLFNNQGVYELMRSDRIDIQRLIDQYKANPDNRPTNIMQRFLEYAPLRSDEAYLDAKDYNAAYNEDKRLKVLFASTANLSEPRNINGHQSPYFTSLELERKIAISATSSYEGIAVYVFCETENDIDAGRRAAALNDQKRVVVAIPQYPIKVADAAFTLKALESEYFRLQAEDFGPQENAEVLTKRNAALQVLKDAKADYFNNAKISWFGKNGSQIPVSETKRHDAANKMMQELYGTKRNTFGHNEFNKSHLNISGTVKAVFVEAGNILCDLSQPIRVNWTWPDNRGGTKYLRKCFVDHQVLRIVAVEGDTRILESEKDIQRFCSSMPAYAEMLDELRASEGKNPTNLLQFLQPYFEDYGQGELAVTLMLLLARRFLGDSLRFKREPTHLADIQFTSTEDMLSLVQGQYPSSVLIIEPVSQEDQEYFAKVTQIFTNEPGTAGNVYTITEAYQAITRWWDSLPIIARSLGFYQEEDKPVAEIISQAKTRDPFRFIKYDLPQKLGVDQGEKLTQGKLMQIDIYLKTFKGAAEAILSTVEDQILTAVGEIFGAISTLDVNIQDALAAWYEGLTVNQRDPLWSHHNNDSLPLVKNHAYANIHELLFKTLPYTYQFGHVVSWTSDYTDALAERIRKGKKHIDEATIVPPPEILFSEDHPTQNGNVVTYQGEIKLHADTHDGKGVIYYTSDGSNPINSLQAQILTPGDTLTIKGNRTVKLVVKDERGDYSATRTVDFIDELLKYKIVRPAQGALIDEKITFYFPQNKEISQVTLTSLLFELDKAGYYGDEELRQAVLRALDEIKL